MFSANTNTNPKILKNEKCLAMSQLMFTISGRFSRGQPLRSHMHIRKINFDSRLINCRLSKLILVFHSLPAAVFYIDYYLGSRQGIFYAGFTTALNLAVGQLTMQQLRILH